MTSSRRPHMPASPSKGHLLEKNWQTYTSQRFRNIEQPVVYNLAKRLQVQSAAIEIDQRRLENENAITLRGHLQKDTQTDSLGYNNIDIQKPRTCDVEDFISLRSSYTCGESVAVKKARTHFHWLNDKKWVQSVRVVNKQLLVSKLQNSDVVTGVENMHKHVVGVWRSKYITSMCDYLQWYNEKDVARIQ